VREKSGLLVPERAIYHVILFISTKAMPGAHPRAISQRGHLSVRAQAEAPAARYWRRAVAVFVQEFGF
jgi:hypothetical protein